MGNNIIHNKTVMSFIVLFGVLVTFGVIAGPTVITEDEINTTSFAGDGALLGNTSAFVTVAKDGSGDFNCAGTDDCTAVIQAAFDYFGSNPADVRMKVGVYQLKSYGIDICSAGTRRTSSWTGCGFGCTFLNASFVGNVTWCDRSSLGAWGISTINIKDMTMFGNGSTDNFILANESMQHSTFENLRLEGISWGGGGQATGAGIYFVTTGGQYYNTVINVRIKNATYGVRFNTPGSTGKKNSNKVYDLYCNDMAGPCVWIQDGYNNNFYNTNTAGYDAHEIIIRLDDADESVFYGVNGDSNQGVINVSINTINTEFYSAFVTNITYHQDAIPKIIWGGLGSAIMSQHLDRVGNITVSSGNYGNMFVNATGFRTTANLTMAAEEDGSMWCCGPTKSGTFLCSSGAC